MKITRKRVLNTTAVAAILTAGVFGGTYAKYLLQVDTQADTARVAKFYVGSSEVNLFANTYDNEEGTLGADIATTDKYTNLIAPNFTATGTLTYDVTSEVKAELKFDDRTKVETNLPADIQKDLKVVVGDTSTGILYTGTVYDLNQANGAGLPSFTKIKDIPAHTVGATIKVPVTISWDLENGHDKVETDAAMAQYVGTDYTLTISAGAVLTQLD